MISLQPQAVMEGYAAIRVASYREDESAELVTMLLNPDQFAAVLHLFYYRKSSHDEVIVPIASGCAQLFRIPFGELRKPVPKAVMGNLDFVSRPFLSKEIFCLTVSGTDFAQMCADSE